MSGAGAIKHKGGEAFFYATRLILHFGGIISHGTKAVTAKSGNNSFAFGIETKLKVAKNQVTGVNYERCNSISTTWIYWSKRYFNYKKRKLIIF